MISANATDALSDVRSAVSPEESSSLIDPSPARAKQAPAVIYGTIAKIEANCPEAMELDRELYPILKSCVSGPWATLLQHVKQPSYVLAMATLHASDHNNISRLAEHLCCA